MNDNAYKHGALDTNDIFKIKTCSRYQLKHHKHHICKNVSMHINKTQIFLPLFVNHQQRGKSIKHIDTFSPFLSETKRSRRGNQNKYDTNSRYDNKVHIDTK